MKAQFIHVRLFCDGSMLARIDRSFSQILTNSLFVSTFHENCCHELVERIVIVERSGCTFIGTMHLMEICSESALYFQYSLVIDFYVVHLTFTIYFSYASYFK